jgi:hypothetical protein
MAQASVGRKDLMNELTKVAQEVRAAGELTQLPREPEHQRCHTRTADTSAVHSQRLVGGGRLAGGQREPETPRPLQLGDREGRRRGRRARRGVAQQANVVHAPSSLRLLRPFRALPLKAGTHSPSAST